MREHIPGADLAAVGDEGYVIRSVAGVTVIAGNTEVGALYGTFAFLRRMQTQKPIDGLDIDSSPRIKNRHLNNWEGTRLYSGNNATGTGGLNGENGDDLQLRRHRRERRPQPAGDPRPLHRGRARARVGRASTASRSTWSTPTTST